MSDFDLELAIALSLQDQQATEVKTKQFRDIHQFTCISCKNTTFTFQSQSKCPSCGNNSENFELMKHISPVTQQIIPRSIVIKPTIGSFLTYSPTKLLHVGLSNTQGSVFNFDERGPIANEKWKEGLCIPIPHSQYTDEAWDRSLIVFHQQELNRVKYNRYSALKNNCYDYVIRFLNLINFEKSSKHTKEDIVDRFIERPVAIFEAFFNVHKNIEENGSFVGADGMTPKKAVEICSCDVCGKQNIQKYHRCQVCTNYDLCEDCFKSGKTSDSHTKDHDVVFICK